MVSNNIRAIERKRWRLRWAFTSLVRKGVLVILALSSVVFTVYLIGSIPDPGFPSQYLLRLVRLLQYLSLLLCVFSLFAMGFSVRRLVNHPSVRSALRLCFYFLTGIFGAGFAMLNSIIIAVSSGHG